MNAQVAAPQYQLQQQDAVMSPHQMVNLPKPSYGTEKQRTILYYLGITEIVLGGVACLFGVIALIVASFDAYAFFTYVSQGIWCGGVIIASGILGIRIRSQPTKCMYNANMAMSIISTNFMAVLVILSAFAAIFDGPGALAGFHIIIAVAGFAGFVITIIHSAYCCAGVCRISQGIRIVYLPSQLPDWHPQQIASIELRSGQPATAYPYQSPVYPYQYPGQIMSYPAAPATGHVAPTANCAAPNTCAMNPVMGNVTPQQPQQKSISPSQQQTDPSDPPSYSSEDVNLVIVE